MTFEEARRLIESIEIPPKLSWAILEGVTNAIYSLRMNDRAILGSVTLVLPSNLAGIETFQRYSTPRVIVRVFPFDVDLAGASSETLSTLEQVSSIIFHVGKELDRGIREHSNDFSGD